MKQRHRQQSFDTEAQEVPVIEPFPVSIEDPLEEKITSFKMV